MLNSNFAARIREFGIRNIVLSYDTLGGLIAFFIIFIHSGGSIDSGTGLNILPNIALVSATLFAIVLTGFTIITSFTDRYFLYAWTEKGDFGGIVTLFQYNLFLPVIVILGSIALFIQYNGIGMLIVISIFVYMILSLLNLVGFIAKYSLQRAEFVKQIVENSSENQDAESDPTMLTTEQLEQIQDILNK